MQPEDTTYRCSRCREVKPLSDFYRYAKGPGGHAPHCKACDAIRARVYSAANREKIKARQAAYYAANRERFAERWARWYAENQASRSESETERSAQWQRDHREAYRIISRASSAVRQAIKRGNLIRPTACEECGKTCKPQGAHHDYSRPLDVRWLCRSCHSRWDIAEPKIMGKHDVAS